MSAAHAPDGLDDHEEHRELCDGEVVLPPGTGEAGVERLSLLAKGGIGDRRALGGAQRVRGGEGGAADLVLPGGQQRLKGELTTLRLAGIQSDGKDQCETYEERGEREREAPGKVGGGMEGGEGSMGGIKGSGEDEASGSRREGPSRWIAVEVGKN